MKDVSAPRGLLKMITLELGTRKPVNGISITRHVTELSNGIWKPSPGSIYYLLNELEKKGLLSLVTLSKNPPFDYVTTKRGQEALSAFSKLAIETAVKQMIFVKMTLQFSGEESASGLADLFVQALKSSPKVRATILEKVQSVFVELKSPSKRKS